MKQPDDRYTLELIPAAIKRGRGRPPKANALTPAQRAKRYRAKRIASNVKPSSVPWFFPYAQPGSLADQHGFRQP